MNTQNRPEVEATLLDFGNLDDYESGLIYTGFNIEATLDGGCEFRSITSEDWGGSFLTTDSTNKAIYV